MAVTQLRITSRQPFAHGQIFGPVGPYEQLSGTVYFAVDPLHAANQLITDLHLAPRDPRGQVHFSADYCLVKPVAPQRGNHRLLFDIVNRGRPLAFRNLNSAPDVAPNDPIDPGNGFLMRQGYTVAFCGWQQDAPEAPGIMRLRGPEAVTPQGPISGKIVVTIQSNVSTPIQRLANSLHRPYPAQRLDDPEAVLTEQDHEEAPERVIPRQEWSFARLENGRAVPDATHVYLTSGFQPGKAFGCPTTPCRSPRTRVGIYTTRTSAEQDRFWLPVEPLAVLCLARPFPFPRPGKHARPQETPAAPLRSVTRRRPIIWSVCNTNLKPCHYREQRYGAPDQPYPAP
jgi:hypothetical protein